MTPTPRNTPASQTDRDPVCGDAAKNLSHPVKSRLLQAEQAFHEALKKGPGDREAFLVTACLGDESLQDEVKRLLAAHEKAASYFEKPVSPEVANELARFKPEEPGDKIGPYKLLEKIGEGGFGTVWVAEQAFPVRRRVALKVIKLGMDTREVVARFEQERQALAMMDHPNIAKVFDAGATPNGRPFFVMELVRGAKLTEYSDQNQLPTRQRIELFIQVCQAVQHAHQKGIIHRDLKPSNILVTITDGIAVPKVIDFGVSKATQGRLSEMTVYTQFEQMIGTPLYMSPEQAEMTSADIDTRSDIYSLGVLLYELLTGQTPIAADTLRRAGMDELRRVIREVDPPRPSLRVKAMGSVELTTAAKRRQVDPGKLTTQLKGDVDWIVMKCLEKDRKRRYETANGLALDLRRHLNNELIAARPPTTGYLLSKLVRRHKMGVAAGTAIAMSVIAGFGVATWMFFKERDARQRAVEAERTQSVLRANAQDSERLAKREATRSKQVANFLQDMLKGVGPANARGKDPGMLTDVLEETEARLSKDLQDEPVVEGAIRMTLGQVHYDLGHYEKAEALHRRALDLLQKFGGNEEAALIATAQVDLGVDLGEVNKVTEAINVASQGVEAMRLLRRAPNTELAHALLQYGMVCWYAGDYTRGESAVKEAVENYEALHLVNDPEYGRMLTHLGGRVNARGAAEESERYSAQAMKVFEPLYGKTHPYYIFSLGNVGMAKHFQGKLAEAEQLLRTALELHVQILPVDHPEYAAPLNNLAMVLRDMDRLEEAEDKLRQAYALTIAKNQVYSVLARNNLSTILRRRAYAEDDHARLIEALRLNPTEPLTMNAVAFMLYRQKLKPLVVGEDAKELPWHYTHAFPAGNWCAPDFSDHAWQSSPPPTGALTFHPRTTKTSFKGRSGLWLRREVVLEKVPEQQIALLVGRYQDARIYLNGVMAAPVADWHDTKFMIPCRPAARATLRPGRNTVAVYCEDADRGTPIDVTIWEGLDIREAQSALLDEYQKLSNVDPARAELYAAQAFCLGSAGRWQDALGSLAQAKNIEPKNWQYRMQLAVLHLAYGNKTAYDTERIALLKDFKAKEQIAVAPEVAFTTMLAPANPAETAAAITIAIEAGGLEYGDSGLPSRRLAKALGDYRSGRFADGVAASDHALESAAIKTLPGWTHEGERNRTIAAQAIKAMAQFGLGQKTQAAEVLHAASELAQIELPAIDSGDLGREWSGMLAARTLLKEAQTLIEGAPGYK